MQYFEWSSFQNLMGQRYRDLQVCMCNCHSQIIKINQRYSQYLEKPSRVGLFLWFISITMILTLRNTSQYC